VPHSSVLRVGFLTLHLTYRVVPHASLVDSLLNTKQIQGRYRSADARSA